MERPKFPVVSARNYPSGKVFYRVDYVDIKTGKRTREAVSSRKDEASRRAAQIHQEQMSMWLGEPSKTITEISVMALIDLFLSRKEGRLAGRLRPA